MRSKLLAPVSRVLNTVTAPDRVVPMLLILLGLPIVVLFAGMTFGAGRPPEKAKPLSEVLIEIEKKGVSPICDVSFDDGSWEIEGYRAGQPVELHVHPIYLSITAEHPEDPQDRPTTGALSAREIAGRLEKAGYSPILELEWDHVQWEAEAVGPQGLQELTIAPTTGEIIASRFDD